MLARHVFKHIGKNVKLFHGIEFSYGYNLTIEDNCTIHKYVLLDDRGEIIVHEGSSISDYANVYSHSHDLNDGMIVDNHKTEIGPKARVTYHATVLSGVRVGEHGIVGSVGSRVEGCGAVSHRGRDSGEADQGEVDRSRGVAEEPGEAVERSSELFWERHAGEALEPQSRHRPRLLIGLHMVVSNSALHDTATI